MNAIDKQAIVACAREYVGTPFLHQGRMKGYGVDCLGLLVGVAKERKIRVEDRRDYDRNPDGKTLLEELRKNLIEIPILEAGLGDILLFWFTRRELPQHVGIKSDIGVIHTYERVGKVVEHRIDEVWERRTLSAFTWQP